MALEFTLEALEREKFGKRASRRYRIDNLIPAEIYGESDGNLWFSKDFRWGPVAQMLSRGDGF